jgi:hypothetical protein
VRVVQADPLLGSGPDNGEGVVNRYIITLIARTQGKSGQLNSSIPDIADKASHRNHRR